MTTTHIMLDIETLGTRPGCVIASIGACTFDPETGAVARQTFYDVIDIPDAVAAGLVIEPGTVLWWMRQDDVSRAEITRQGGRSTLIDALSSFSAWFSEVGATESTQVWANGASFDFPILEAGYRAAGLTAPWAYWQQRCFRTARKLLPVFETRMQGTKHNALDDAKHQAELLVVALRRQAQRRQRHSEAKRLMQELHAHLTGIEAANIPQALQDGIASIVTHDKEMA